MKKFLNIHKAVKIIFLLAFLISGLNANAEELCSKDGYTVLTINGMLTSLNGAMENKDKIIKILPLKYKNQNVYVDYIYNKSHSFLSDFVDSYVQKMTEGEVSYTLDIKNMLVDLSKKLKTQKVLFVAHSQGNFYANDMYNLLEDKDGGISVGSMSIYGIGTPTSYIAGTGRYILSKNDEIINKIRLGGLIDVLPPNVDIPRSKEYDMDGHSLSLVYLKHQNKRIASDILSLLNFLSNDKAQDEKSLCVNPPKITKLDKTVESFFYVMDPAVNAVEKVAKDTFDVTKKVAGFVWKATKFVANTTSHLFASPLYFDYSKKEIVKEDQKLDAKNEDLNQENQESENKDKKIENKNFTEKKESNEQDFLVKDDKVQKEQKDSDLKKEILKLEEKVEDKKIVSRGGGRNINVERDTGQNENPENPTNNNPPPQNPQNPPTPENPNPQNPPTPENPPVVQDPNKDTVPPVITINGDLYLRVSKGYEYKEMGVYARDSVDGNVEVFSSNNINKDEDGIYFVKYEAVDKSGNKSYAQRTIEIYTPLPSFFVDEDTELPAGEYFFENIVVTNNATLKILSDIETPNKNFRGVKIFANNLTVDSGSSISSMGTGYRNGPGSTEYEFLGGSHGGDGNFSAYNYKTYGSALMPTELGSNGPVVYYPYNGGGAIWLDIKDTLENNGVITSAGATNSSGGSVYIKTKKISGEGRIDADGGGGSSGNFFVNPGGGGRVAVYFEDRDDFSGIVRAKGGGMSFNGYSAEYSENGTAGMFDMKNKKIYVDSSWVFSSRDNYVDYKDIEVNGGEVRVEEGTEISLDKMVLKNSSVLSLAGAQNFEVKDLSLDSYSTINTRAEDPIIINADDLYVGADSKIDAIGMGYLYGPGSPDPINFQDTAASYGGKGAGISPKPIYGDENNPNDFGSGSMSFRGGGLIKLNVKNNFTNNGLIIADGYRFLTSGGAINIKTNNFSGNGNIFARGTDSYYPYMGLGAGGGRIAVRFKENNFTGQISASGGQFCLYGCAVYGGNGTVKLIDLDEPQTEEPVLKSDANKILKFSLQGLGIDALIDDTNKMITATVESDVDMAMIIPIIEISPLASLDKESGVAQDFKNMITYKVTSESGLENIYSVLISKNTNQNDGGIVLPVDSEAPFVETFTLNGTSEDIVADPFLDRVVIDIKANESVDWVSIEIENIDNTSLRKLYYSGASCEDGGDRCLKTWDGMLSGANTLLEEGTYRVNVHIKDLSGNDTLYTLPSMIYAKKRG